MIIDLARNLSFLEDYILMVPQNTQEKHSTRDPYRDFRRVFRDLHILSYNNIKNLKLREATDYWFEQPYRAESKHEVFSDGMALAQMYITEMYELGLLDLNVAQPCEFPFDKILHDYYLEQMQDKQEIPEETNLMEVEHGII